MTNPARHAARVTNNGDDANDDAAVGGGVGKGEGAKEAHHPWQPPLPTPKRANL